MGGAGFSAVENVGVDLSAPNCRSGKCGSGKSGKVMYGK